MQRILLPSTAIEVEAWATRRAMELALETGLNNGVLQGDSLILVNVLKSNSHSLAQFGHVIDDRHHCYKYYFGVCFGLSIEMEYFDINLFRCTFLNHFGITTYISN